DEDEEERSEELGEEPPPLLGRVLEVLDRLPERLELRAEVAGDGVVHLSVSERTPPADLAHGRHTAPASVRRSTVRRARRVADHRHESTLVTRGCQHLSMEFEVGVAQTEDEKEAVYRFRYTVYVEEMGRYQGSADHEGRRLVEPEDVESFIVYARDAGEVVGTARLTWGGTGFSPRQ